MSNTKIIDLRGWDQSDPFTLPIIGAIHTLEQEGIITEDIPKRMRTIGDASLALSEQLDYFSFDIVPRLNDLLKAFKEEPSNIRENELLTQIGRTLVDAIKTLNVINDYLKRFLIEIDHYADIYDFEDWDKLTKNGQEELLQRGKDLLKTAQDGENFNSFYRFINSNRNFAEHNGSLIPDEINGDEIIFLKRNSDPSSKISSTDILAELNKFKHIRQKTQQSLMSPDFWREHIQNASN